VFSFLVLLRPLRRLDDFLVAMFPLLESNLFKPQL
jgi:hypothetical protein